jgi:tetraacyldisaccharide 4'-kinase
VLEAICQTSPVDRHAVRSRDDYFRSLVSGQARGIRPALARRGLWLASIPYGAAVRARNWLYDRGFKRCLRAPVPVISIGNLTLGGTGKTPCVECVARLAREADRRVAILSRGYAGSGGRNDEAMVLEQNLPDVPHLQGADRAELAQIAVEELESEVLILDDGFQHRRLKRDLDLVLIDATEPWGHGSLFPRGLLREPPGGLRRADVAILTRADQVQEEAIRTIKNRIAQFAPELPIVEAAHCPIELVNSDGETESVESIRHCPVAAFCGIGNPGGFRRTLLDLGAELASVRVYPDHHAYTREDIEELRSWSDAQDAGCPILTTQKDLVKIGLPDLRKRPLWAVRIGFEIMTGKDVLEERLRPILCAGKMPGF